MDIVRDPRLRLYLSLNEPDGVSLVSKDAYGHPCTVDGALWTLQGRMFDGVNDLISINSLTSGGFFGGAHTIVVWAELTDWSRYRCLLAAGRTDSVAYWSQIYFDTNTGFIKGATCSQAGGINIVANDIDLADNSDFHFYALMVNDDGRIDHFIVDDTDYGSDYTHKNDLSSINKFYIGQIPYTSPNTNPWKGTIGDVFIFNRELTTAEVAYIKRLTDWRYR